jgi:hypothetical protein
MAQIEVEFWNAPYKEADSELVRIELWEDNDKSFEKFYHENNKWKYCNGTHYAFKDEEVNRRYREEFFPKYHTISNYYGNGVVD